MKKRYQIFISSTYKDLIEERQKVTQAILKLYHFPIGMEMFHADNAEQWCQIKNTIDMSDYFVLIIGRYCGTLFEEGISYTEKEYDYALSKGIPVLSFIIADDAKKELYGVETNKQQATLRKFVKKVKKLPCEFWNTADQLACQVTAALSVKFLEQNRNGWIPYNPANISILETIDEKYVGEYQVLYYSQMKGIKQKLIKSKLYIEKNGNVRFYNNIREDGGAEYYYCGGCDIESTSIYISLKNNDSRERTFISMINPVGNLSRFIGCFTAMSSNMIPVSIKIVCIKNSLLEKRNINYELLQYILTSSNKCWHSNLLIIEAEQEHLFFSDEIFM